MSGRRPIVCGNWKMNLNHFEAIQTVQKTYWSLKPEHLRAVDVVVMAPFTDLRSVQTVIENDSMGIGFGAQNCHWEDAGAFTGEVSAAFLAKLNASHVIVGHSERRQMFGETDETVARKVAAVLKHNMVPVICVGETLDQHNEGQAVDVVSQQVRAALSGVGKVSGERLVFAYEPVWAIGADQAASPDDVQLMTGAIREVVGDVMGDAAAAEVRIQYGGAVDAGTAGKLIEIEDVDGFLVGRASLDPEAFARIVAAIAV